MKCDHCAKAATEHFTEVSRGARVERHLCGACAAAVATADPFSIRCDVNAAKAWHADQQRSCRAAHGEQICAGCGGKTGVLVTEARGGRATTVRYCAQCWGKAEAGLDGWPYGEVDLERLMQAFIRFENATHGRRATQAELIAMVKAAIRI